MLRIGSGFDVHPLVPGGPLKLGCIALPIDMHLRGHSDGDCAAHAVADALLSAAISRDLGDVFPLTPENLGISGCSILQKTVDLMNKAGASIVNVDLSIICDQPQLVRHLESMRIAMAGCLDIRQNYIMIKARHVEGLAFRREHAGIAALAAVLVNHGSNRVE